MAKHRKWDLEIPDPSVTNPFIRTESAQKVLAAIRKRYARVPSSFSSRLKQEELSRPSSPTMANGPNNQALFTPSPTVQPSSQIIRGARTFTCALQQRLERQIDYRGGENSAVDKNNNDHIPKETSNASTLKRKTDTINTNTSKTSNQTKATTNKSQVFSVESMTPAQRLIVEQNLLSAEEVACSLVFEDGTTQLRSGNQQKKKRLNKPKPCDIAFTFPWCENMDKLDGDFNTVSPGQLTFVKISLESANGQIKEWTRRVIGQLMESNTRKICYNAQEIASWLLRLHKYDVQKICSDWIFMDVKIAVWLLEPDNPPKEYSELLQKVDLKLTPKENSDKDELLSLDLSTLGPAVLSLYDRLQANELWDLYWSLEMPLCPIMAVMEAEGIQINTQVLLDTSNILKENIKKLEAKAHEAAGHKFLINSSHQLRQVLFGELKLDQKCEKPLEKTATNSYISTSEGVLLELQHLHPLPKLVLEYRQLVKLKSTYFDGMLPYVKDGVIHTTWEHTAAATGRLTSANPNLQNIPKQSIQISSIASHYIVGKEEEKMTIFPREAFNSRDGWSFLAADFQSIELRLLAHLSNDPALLKVFNDKDSSDVFVSLTSQWLGIKPEDVQFQEREQTKRIVYSVVYGVGRERLAKNLGVNTDKAKDFMKSFLDKFPGISLFTRQCIEKCKKNGYVSTIFKRRRWFPNINASQFSLRSQAERQAVNFVVQGSAADICKSSMIEVLRAFRNDSVIHARLLLQIHDELLFEVPDQEIITLKGLIKSIMENSATLYSEKAQLKVLLPVSVSTGKKWSHMTDCDMATK